MRYKVVGNHPVAGAAPGRTVDLDPDDARTRALVRAGHIQARPPRATATPDGGKA